MPSKLYPESKGDCSKLLKDKGAALVFCVLCLFVFVGVTALSIDLGRAYAEQRRLQFAADAASMAAVNLLSPTATFNAIQSESENLAVANGFKAGDVQTNCGIWDVATKQFEPSDCGAANAVRVEASGQLEMKFARVFGPNFLNLVRPAIAMAQGSNLMNCVKPFAFPDALIQQAINQGLTQFTVPVGGPGNWGKINLGSQGGQSEIECNPSGPLGGNGAPAQFFQSMLNGVCNAQIEIGDLVPVITGNASTGQGVFLALQGCGAHEELFFATTGPFPNGAGNVEVVNFAKLNFISAAGNGNSATVTFEIVEYGIVPDQHQSNEGSGRTLTY